MGFYVVDRVPARRARSPLNSPEEYLPYTVR